MVKPYQKLGPRGGSSFAVVPPASARLPLPRGF